MDKKRIKKEVKFKYVFPKDLRDYYINGAWGGVTPRKEIHMHLYSERHPIPKALVYEIKDDGSLGDEGAKVFGGDVVRLIQTSVVMDVGTAEAIRDWLTDKIKFIAKLKDNKGG